MSHFDVAEIGDPKLATVDEMGDVVLDVEASSLEIIEGARFRQQLGVRAMPTVKHDLDAIFMRSGDEAEVTSVADADATAKLGPIATGETQLYSTGDKPAAISVKDTGIKLGLNAVDAVACEGDEIDAGTLIVVTVMGVVTAVSYIPPAGTIGPLPMGGVTVPLKGIIKPTKRKTTSE